MNNLKLFYQTDVFAEEVDLDFLKDVFGREYVIPFTRQDILNSNKDLLLELYNSTNYFIRSSCQSFKFLKRKKESRIVEKFDCTDWLPKMKRFALNSDYNFLDLEELQQRFDFFADYELFVRPNSGDKVFSGNVFTYHALKLELDHLRQRNIDPREILCMYAPLKELNKEYRLIFIDGKYVSGSQYLNGGEIDISNVVTPNVIEFAQTIMDSNPIYTDFCIDIVEGDNSSKIVEFNSIHTSSFYSADMAAIYKKIKKTFDAH